LSYFLTWENAAWIYSVIVGLALARYFMFIASLLQEPKAIKFYYPYLVFTLANILNLYWSWYIGKTFYTQIEGHTLAFSLRTFMDAIGCIGALMIVPPDKLLEGFFDMKTWFMNIKRVFCLIMALYTLALIMLIVLFYVKSTTVEGQHVRISRAIGYLVSMLLYVGSAFSKNDYYLSFHGTLMVVMYSYVLLSQLSGPSDLGNLR